MLVEAICKDDELIQISIFSASKSINGKVKRQN